MSEETPAVHVFRHGQKRSPALRFGVAMLACAVSLAVGLEFRPASYSTPYLFFYPAVLVALWYGGIFPGLLATFLSALAVDYYFLPPLGIFPLHVPTILRGIFFSLSFGLICWLIDTRKVRAEAAIERQLRLLNIAFEPIIVFDIDSRILFWNRGARQLYGWVESEALGQNIHDLLKTEFPEPIEAIRAQLVKDGRWHGELIHHKKDGTEILVASWWTLDQASTKDWAILEANFDLTERKQVEEALRASEADLKHAQAVSCTGSWRLNVQRDELLWSDETYRMFGIPAGTPLTYEIFLGAVHPDDRDFVDERWKAALRGAPYDIEHRIVANGTVKWVRETAELEFDSNGVLLGGFGAVQDITERKRAEEILLKSEKLASTGRLAATIAHEINNPLAGAMNAVFLVGKEESLSPQGRKFAALADQELRRAAQIARRTLGFFREPNSRAAVPLKQLIDELTGLYEPRLKERGVEIRERWADETVLVWGNVGELRQLISNLVLNSLDALGESGTVHVRVGKVSILNGAPTVRFTVADTGSGIERHNLNRIFEPFFTTKKDVGTGLGLWITQEIVKQHGGKLRVRSRPGWGTVFSITLPAVSTGLTMATANDERHL